MRFERLPHSLQILYAELLDQLRAAEGTMLGLGASGSFVSKKIRERTYWYFQRVDAGKKTQAYLGPETPELLEQIAATKENRALGSDDIKRRKELVSMLVAGGAAHAGAAFASVFQVLADAFVFRLGGVLVGTHALSCYANMLGVRFEGQSLRTADIDVAHDRSISVGISQEETVDLFEKLKEVEPRFVVVPELDPREPSTSFMVRGRDLRVDFVTPAKGRNQTKPVPLPHLRLAAQPLPGLDYLIEMSTKAAIVGGSGILVNVPLPARYALHKFWVSSKRPVSEQAKARKDVLQAEQVLEVLLHDRPGDIEEAVSAMKSRPKMWNRVKTHVARITTEGVKENQD